MLPIHNAPASPSADARAQQPSPESHSPLARTASRASSIRRKPVPQIDPGELEHVHSRASGGWAPAAGSGQAGVLDSERQPAQDTLTPSPSTALTLHGFPLLRPAPTPPSPSAYSPVSSVFVSTAAGPSLAQNQGSLPYHPAHREERRASSQQAVDLPVRPPSLSARQSVHSQQSSLGGESVFGTPPVGVIGKTRPREVIRVERDYSAGETCQFWSGWVWELEGRVSPTDYQNTLNEVNAVLASAHDPARSVLDNCLAILTLYLSPLFITSHYEREIRRLHSLLERANRELYNPAGLNLLSPHTTAFLFWEIEYY